METKFIFTGKECDLEAHVIDNIADIAELCGWGKIKRVERQFVLPVSNGRLIADVMLWHEDGTGTVIECKTGRTNRNDLLMGISQLMFYGVYLEASLGAMPRLVLVTPSYSQIVQSTIKRFGLPINLLTIDGDRCTYLSELVNNG